MHYLAAADVDAVMGVAASRGDNVSRKGRRIVPGHEPFLLRRHAVLCIVSSKGGFADHDSPPWRALSIRRVAVEFPRVLALVTLETGAGGGGAVGGAAEGYNAAGNTPLGAVEVS
jgi:hypothetical protein